MTCSSRPLALTRSLSLLAIGLVVILFGSIVFPAHAVSFTPGVHKGDSAYYSVRTDSPTYVVGGSVSKMNVLSVAGTNVSASFFSFYPDGGISPNQFSVDVFTGAIYNSSSNFFFVIAANLPGGSPIFDGWTVTLQGPNTITCGGVPRQAVGAQFFRNLQNVRLAWDQATGAMCGYTAADNRGTIFVSMINGTFWAPPAPPLDAFAVAAEISSAIGLPLLVIVLFVYFRRRRVRLKPS